MNKTSQGKEIKRKKRNLKKPQIQKTLKNKDRLKIDTQRYTVKNGTRCYIPDSSHTVHRKQKLT